MIRVLDTKQEFTSILVREKVIKKGCAKASNMHHSSGTGSKTGSHFALAMMVPRI